MIAEVSGAVARKVGAMGRKQVSTGKKAVILVGFCTAQLLDIATTHIGLSQGHQELNGIAAWVIGMRNMLRALLLALLEPPGVKSAEAAGDSTARLALQEEAKSLPFGAVWDSFCEAQGVPVGEAWLAEVKRYEREVLLNR